MTRSLAYTERLGHTDPETFATSTSLSITSKCGLVYFQLNCFQDYRVLNCKQPLSAHALMAGDGLSAREPNVPLSADSELIPSALISTVHTETRTQNLEEMLKVLQNPSALLMILLSHPNMQTLSEEGKTGD